MSIWVDADACPVAAREILFRAAERVQRPLTLVANRPLRTPPSRWIRSIVVAAGFDVADERIAGEVAEGDIVVTSDVPLAADVLERGARVITPRGEDLTPDNIRDRLATRDLMETLRSSGMAGGGPAAYGQKERQAFANALDRLLARR